ncbi:MAG: hypothetical protein C0485_09880 [Pirellula sp.]|nr:hypothetical protein [Pirellula sp.]
MASLSTYKGGKKKGRHRILFTDPTGKRQTIYLDRIPKRTAEGVQRAITELERAARYGHSAADFALAWLTTAGDDVRDRLTKFGLASARTVEAPEAVTLGTLVDLYQLRPEWQQLKPKTIKNKLRHFKLALAFYGADKPVESITKADAKAFYAMLQLPEAKGGHDFAAATANQTASTLFALVSFAIDAELVDRNVFKVLPRKARKGNNVNVCEAASLAVLDSLQNTEDKLLFALGRWGGLRMPSEGTQLRWQDVDWERERFYTRSPKTERHEGREGRWVPIYAPLAPLFREMFEKAADGAVYVLPNYCHAIYSKPTQTLKQAVKRAGVEPWPRLWHSCRATRQTELAADFPAHVVASWQGNTVAVADAHYLMVRELDFANATRKATQHTPATTDNEQQESKATPANPR